MSRESSITGAIATFLLVFCVVGCNRGLNSREAQLRHDLSTLRAVIGQFTLDKQRAPESLQEIVEAGYLKSLPVDPITNLPDWSPEFKDVGKDRPGIIDVHSRSNLMSSDGRPYSYW